MQSLNPFCAAESAIAIQIERMRATEAIAARDAIAQHLSSACRSIRDKSATIENLRQQNKYLEDILKEHSAAYTSDEHVRPAGQEPTTGCVGPTDENSKVQNNTLKEQLSNSEEEPPKYEATEAFSQLSITCAKTPESDVQSTRQDALRFLREATYNNFARVGSPPASALDTPTTPKMIVSDLNDLDIKVVTNSLHQLPEAEESIRSRHAILATLPLPVGVPSDALRPILIPPSYTLHEFLASAIGVRPFQQFVGEMYSPGVTVKALRTALTNHHVFQQLTTNWCPEREEHGYFLTPLFKCTTNPRVATAHRWTMVDVISKLDKPTAECFYNKDGKWYYAGVYKALRLDDLTSKEFEQLSSEASWLSFFFWFHFSLNIYPLIKETLAGRKNVSPQTVYETNQLYLAGALKVACVGLQCVGFNNLLYRTIIEQATRCAQTGRWRGPFGFDLRLNSDAELTPRLFSLPRTSVDCLDDGGNKDTLAGEFHKTE
ncbi:hypothetical protein H4582DRAFT_1842370 [Lactarius indigo]|nr:hypothetical protein H4582DRAFT_1842370 [Lactarius indigo]